MLSDSIIFGGLLDLGYRLEITWGHMLTSLDPNLQETSMLYGSELQAHTHELRVKSRHRYGRYQQI